MTNQADVRALVRRARETADLAERRRLDRKPNGHPENCVCRECFETWRAERDRE